MSDKMTEYRQQYNEIMALYDYADELASTVESGFVESPQDQLNLVKPLIEQIEESSDVLTEEFIEYAGGSAGKRARGRIEKALRKIYMAIDDYTLRLHGTLKTEARGISNIADSIIMKLKEKLEEVIVIFLQFTELSLDRMMHKAELEEMKRKQQHVFFQLHNMAQQH